MSGTQMRFNLPVGQWIDLDGKLLRLVRRARDSEQRLVFEGADAVPHDMTDEELLDLQQVKRRLRLLTPDEAAGRLGDTKVPRVTQAAAGAAEADEGRRKLDYVLGWEAAGRPSRTAAGMAPVIHAVFDERRRARAEPQEHAPPCARHVIRWIADWLRSGRDFGSLLPQARNRGNASDRLLPAARDLLDSVVEERYLSDTRLTAVAVHKHVEDAFTARNAGLPPAGQIPAPSLTAVYRCIARLDNYIVDCTRDGRRAADQKWRPVGAGPLAEKHNDTWEIDHTVVDAIVIDDGTRLPIGRPYVTATIDRHSRAVTGFHIGFDPPGTYPVLECLRVAIMRKEGLLADAGVDGTWACMGTPEVLVTDQGKEFKARTFVDACLMLGIHIQYTPVKRPWYKGRIERYFRTLTTDVFQRVPGTTFSDIFERSKEKVPEKVAIVTLAELRWHTLHYIVAVYNGRKHRGIGMPPAKAWDLSVQRHGMGPLPDPDRVTEALSPAENRIPQRYGIEYEGLLYNSPQVTAFRIRTAGRQSVRIAVDPHDLTAIRFLDPADNRFHEVPIRTSLLDGVRGVPLHKHKLARALQRANPERLAGEAGRLRAYVLIDNAMLELGAAPSSEARKKAARYREALTKAKPPEEAPAFDTVASKRGVTEGLFGDGPGPDGEAAAGAAPAGEAPAGEAADGGVAAEAAPAPPPPAPPPAVDGRKRKKPKPAPPPAAPADGAVPAAAAAPGDADEDMRALARSMAVRWNGGDAG